MEGTFKDEIGGRKDRTEQPEIEHVGAIVARGHHAHRDAHAGLARLVGRQKIARAEERVVGEIERHLLRLGNLRRDLHGEVGVVFSGKHPVGHLVENLREPGGVILADGKHERLSDLAADGIAQRVFEKRLAEKLVGRGREEAFLKLALLVGLFWSSPCSSLNSTTNPDSESSSVVISLRASTTVGLMRKPSFTPSRSE